MGTERIKAYCTKPNCLLKRIGIRSYNVYNLSEIENIVSKLSKEFTDLEFKLRKEDIVVESQRDLFKKELIDGAVIRTRDYAVAIHLEWYDFERIDAEIRFDRNYKHPDDEYAGIKRIMQHYNFHILKQKE